MNLNSIHLIYNNISASPQDILYIYTIQEYACLLIHYLLQ